MAIATSTAAMISAAVALAGAAAGTVSAVQGGFHLIPVGGGELFRFCGYLRKCFCC